MHSQFEASLADLQILHNIPRLEIHILPDQAVDIVGVTVKGQILYHLQYKVVMDIHIVDLSLLPLHQSRVLLEKFLKKRIHQ
jgi:hypothetical protein